jgi:hypothetical protein
MSRTPSLAFVPLLVAAAIVSAAVGMGACGGSKAPPTGDPTPSETTDSGTQPPAGEPDAGAETPTPDAGMADAGTPDAGGSVLCGNTICTGGLQCCFLGLDAGSIAQCRPSCETGNEVACDGPEDCSGAAPLCCFSGQLQGVGSVCYPSSVTSVCQASCPLIQPPGCTGKVQATICTQKSDCATNTPYVHCCRVRLNASGPAAQVNVCTDKTDAGTCLD